MPLLSDLLQRGQPVPHHTPWPRVRVDEDVWLMAREHLGDGALTLLGLWGEPSTVHMALLDADAATPAIISLDCASRHFPSIARHHPPALRLERAMRDLYGLIPDGLPDTRPWLDHGADDPSPPDYAFLPSDGDGLHQIPVGPVHAGIIEPGHFRFTANGETVVRLEQRLGYVHKGIERLMAGADINTGARLAGRTSGDSMVAYAFAFACAVENALGVSAPPRAIWLRAVMAELERLANHLGDIGAICNDASFALMQAHCAILREQVLRASEHAFGHRLMRDVIVPGGIAHDLHADGRTGLQTLLDDVSLRFPALIELYDNTASLQDRTVGTGVVTSALARHFGASGYIGRAASRAFDARRAVAYAPYDTLIFDVPVFTAGDVNARVWVRIREIEQSLALIARLLAQLPDGAIHRDLPQAVAMREGVALVEGFRGDILAWLRLGADGRIVHCHLRDPSWFQWPLLEAAIEGNIVADFPLCNKSFNCSYAGHDL